jgi:hypothetical protein
MTFHQKEKIPLPLCILNVLQGKHGEGPWAISWLCLFILACSTLLFLQSIGDHPTSESTLAYQSPLSSKSPTQPLSLGKPKPEGIRWDQPLAKPPTVIIPLPKLTKSETESWRDFCGNLGRDLIISKKGEPLCKPTDVRVTAKTFKKEKSTQPTPQKSRRTHKPLSQKRLSALQTICAKTDRVVHYSSSGEALCKKPQ